LEFRLVFSRSLETKRFALGWDLDKMNNHRRKGMSPTYGATASEDAFAAALGSGN
jgi:hypothetical protein